MKVLNCRVKNLVDYDNHPYLELLVDEIPDDIVFEHKGTHYYAEKDGYVRFFHYTGPSDGFGGREFKLNMKDGTEKVLYGSWSGNSLGVANDGFPETVNVSITDNPKVFEKGYTFNSGHITFELFKELSQEFNFAYGWDKSGFCFPVVSCDCGNKNVQRYKTKQGRKFVCDNCLDKFGITEDTQKSFVTNYNRVEPKKVMFASIDNIQAQIIS